MSVSHSAGTRLVKVLAVGFLLLLVNSSYLAVFDTPTVLYVGNIMLHLGLGIGLTALFLIFLSRNWSGLSSAARMIVALFLTSACGGIYILIAASNHTKPHRWASKAHIIAGTLGTLLLILAMLRRRGQSHAQYGVLARALSLALAFAMLLVLTAGFYVRYSRASRDQISNPTLPPFSMDGEGAGPSSPFFPSSANTNVNGIIPATFFMTSEVCARCHKDIYDQWNSSAHHFSSFNNQWYRKSIEYMQDVIGTRGSKWCAGCHDHQFSSMAALTGRSRSRSILRRRRTVSAAPPVTRSFTCAALWGRPILISSTRRFTTLAASKNRFLQWGHDFMTFADTEPHKRTFLKPFMRQNTPEFCSSCHKVHLDVPVNGYRWFRGFNDYDNWQASGVSGQGARAFYYPAKSMKCADCHMALVPSNDPAAKNGMIRSHRFAAANTACLLSTRTKSSSKRSSTS